MSYFKRLDLLPFKLSCICKYLGLLTSASTAMNNDHWSQGRETGRHGKPYSGAAKNWLLLRVTALFVAKGWVLGSLRKAVLLSL